MRRRAQEASYGPDGDGARMVLPLRRQCGNIWNRNESHVPFSEWTISVPLSVCLRSHTSGTIAVIFQPLYVYLWTFFFYLPVFSFFLLTATFPFGVTGRVFETIPAA